MLKKKKNLEVNLMQFFFFKFYKNNLTQFYSTELNYPSLKMNIKKIIIKILQRYSTLFQKLIINFNVFMVIISFY